MVEALAFHLPRPLIAAGIQQIDRADHIGAHEGKRIFDGTIHMAFSRQMDDPVEGELLKELVHLHGISDVGTDKLIIGCVGNVGQVAQIARIGQ